eukprot:3705087-Rhodomonas_salina.2
MPLRAALVPQPDAPRRCSPILLHHVWYWPTGPCYAMSLCACYAMSGTDTPHVPTSCPWRSAHAARDFFP